MSWASMSAELANQCPVPFLFARTLVNRAWFNVQRKHTWSFLWGKAAIPTPIPITSGTVTVTPGSNTVIGDAAATAAWALAGLVNPLTVRQFRVGQGTIYNINAYTVAGGFGVLTLDSPYVDPTFGAGTGYQIFQCYYSGPVADFLWWESVTDPISGYSFRTTMTREEVDNQDPQRFQDGWPVGVIPYQINPQAGNFNGFPQYEAWPSPLNGYTYFGTYFRRGTLFVNDTDVVNPMLGEDVVMQLAKMYAYEWALVNSDKVPKGDYRFAYGAAKKQYDELIDDYILKDEETSHRHVINAPEDSFIGALPWVSQKAGIYYAP